MNYESVSELLKIWLPISTSLVALILSFATLSWTIYKDTIRKPKFRVSVSIKRVIRYGHPPTPRFVALEALNLGPGPNRIGSTFARKNWLNRNIFDRANSRAFIAPDFSHSVATPAGQRVEVGDTATLVFPYDNGATEFFEENFTQIGVFDGYGRVHYAPRNELKAIQLKHRKRIRPPS